MGRQCQTIQCITIYIPLAVLKYFVEAKLVMLYRITYFKLKVISNNLCWQDIIKIWCTVTVITAFSTAVIVLLNIHWYWFAQCYHWRNLCSLGTSILDHRISALRHLYNWGFYSLSWSHNLLTKNQRYVVSVAAPQLLPNLFCRCHQVDESNHSVLKKEEMSMHQEMLSFSTVVPPSMFVSSASIVQYMMVPFPLPW